MSITVIGPGKPVLLCKGKEGTVDVVLSWTTDIDVGLACMYELSTSQKGVVQALKPDPNFGSLSYLPFIRLRNDDRTGAKKGGGEEMLQVSLRHAAAIRRLLVFAYVYDKSSTWRKVRNAAVNIGHPAQGNYDFRLGCNRFGFPSLRRWSARSCVLFTMERDHRSNFVMTPQGTYFKGAHQQISDAYNMGLTFALHGYKD